MPNKRCTGGGGRARLKSPNASKYVLMSADAKTTPKAAQLDPIPNSPTPDACYTTNIATPALAARILGRRVDGGSALREVAFPGFNDNI